MPVQPKQKPTHPEALLLIRMKRDRAKAAMDQIVKRFGVISHDPEPGLEILLDYLTNMVYALELLLKAMADDWKTHNVGKMYESIFGKPHDSPHLMTILMGAILNQKFIYEPADRLMDHIPELEALWDELTTEFYQRPRLEHRTMQREVEAPKELIQFLQDNFSRFYRAKTQQRKPVMSREHQVQMLQHQIHDLQAELERVQAGEAAPEESPIQVANRLQQEHIASLEGAKSTFEIKSKIWEEKFTFGTWTFGKVLPGCLG